MPNDTYAPPAPPGDGRAYTALMHAARMGQLQKLHARIQAGDDVNAADGRGVTALMLAVENRHAAVVQALVAAAAHVDAADEDRVTALMRAAQCRSPAIARCLLAHDADANARDDLGHSAWTYAVNARNQPMIEALLDSRAAFDVQPGGMPLLTQAAFVGDVPIMACLVDAGADVDARNASGSTALMYAVETAPARHPAAPEFLLAAGAEIDAADGEGNTALMRAALAGKWAALDLLTARGASLDAANHHGLTPRDIVRLAFRATGPVLDQDGLSRICRAAERGHATVLDVLLDAAAQHAAGALAQGMPAVAALPHETRPQTPAPQLPALDDATDDLACITAAAPTLASADFFSH